jgi:hypothetical protein
MPFLIRPYRRFLVNCAVTYQAGLFVKVPAGLQFGWWGKLHEGLSRLVF